MEYSDQLTLFDVQYLIEQTEEWEKELSKSKAEFESSKLKSLLKSLGKMFKGRVF